MRKVFEEKFLKKYAKNTPQEIVEDYGRKAFATVAQIQEESRKDETRLRAAQVFLDRYYPVKTTTEHTGNVTLNVKTNIDV